MDLVKTVWALQILSQKFIRNFVIKQLWALENHVLVDMLLCSCHFTWKNSLSLEKDFIFSFHINFINLCLSVSVSLFHAKSENIKVLHVKNIWDLSSFIEQDISDNKVDHFFWMCHFSQKLSYHRYQQPVCKIIFSIRTFVKKNINLMCGSF